MASFVQPVPKCSLMLRQYVSWTAIVSFVVRYAHALKHFVEAAYHNPKLFEIIDLVVQAARHLN